MSELVKLTTTNSRSNLLPFSVYLGGAFWTANQPGMGFWDGVVWLWYVGRYIAQHYTAF